ncbi:MAG TPA: Asp23/Gls24 family envelope stress response protein [Ktedonobacteraceae bacterium]|nr:Asp23/Gls24 family envelope stress response protein [Ktedonobacteraceae bacterium]
MAETRTGDTASTTQAGQNSQRGLAQSLSSSVVVNQATATKGKTTIANVVVAKIVGIAAREIDGVKDVVSTGAGAAITGLATRVTRGDMRAQGVSVEVGEREAAASINIVVNYGVSIPLVAEAVRRNIIDRVETMTGLTMIAVDIAVNDLYFPEEETEAERPRVQ